MELSSCFTFKSTTRWWTSPIPRLSAITLLAGSELTTQVIAKRDPHEKVGNVVSVDGHLQIIEYSDLPPESAERRIPMVRLLIWAGNIAVHMFDCAFLQRMAHQRGGLPWHLARKKVPFINERGDPITPDKPNAIKLETFIFDLLPNAKNALGRGGQRGRRIRSAEERQRSAQGYARNLSSGDRRRHRRWLIEAGAQVADNVAVEISAGSRWTLPS